MKERLVKDGKNHYCFYDVNGEEWEIELERITYCDEDCFVETELDFDTVQDPSIRMELEALEHSYESDRYDCSDWDYVLDKINRND